MPHHRNAITQLDALPQLSRDELRTLWTKELSETPPSSLGRDILALGIAYARQERLYGGLSRRVAKELDLRVAQRTRELAAANEELKREIAERERAEEKQRQDEKQLKRSEAFLAEGQRLSSTGSFSWRVASNEITWSDQIYRIFEIDPLLPVTLQLMNTRTHPEDIAAFNDELARARR